jgi:outer membrane immunogenic protein
MQALTRFAITFVAAGSLAVISYAGTEQQAPKEVAAVAPPACEWGGFYIGASAGGQFGHSEDHDLGLNNVTAYNAPDRPWGYHEDGVSVSEQMGYNWQFGHFVFGPEVEAGYMNLKGSGLEPGDPHDTDGSSKSDIFATFRGRVGFAAGCWLFYGTGGGIGVNYTTRIFDDTVTAPNGLDRIDAHREHFELGYTAGGGVERMFNMWGHRWSVKVEYLYFDLGDQGFSATSANGFGPYHWHGDTAGHIVRAGFNYHF